jgi:hypothetical protein
LFVPNTKIYDTSHLKILPRIFSIISKFGLLPRKGSYSLLDEEDLIITHHLFTGQKLNLPHMIIHYMMKVKPRNRKFCVPYGMALTKIFEKFRVPLDGEESEENTSFFGPKNLKHNKPEIVEPCDDCKLCNNNEKPCLKTYKNGKRKRDKETFTIAPTSPIQNETQTAPRVSEPSPNYAQNG